MARGRAAPSPRRRLLSRSHSCRRRHYVSHCERSSVGLLRGNQKTEKALQPTPQTQVPQHRRPGPPRGHRRQRAQEVPLARGLGGQQGHEAAPSLPAARPPEKQPSEGPAAFLGAPSHRGPSIPPRSPSFGGLQQLPANESGRIRDLASPTQELAEHWPTVPPGGCCHLCHHSVSHLGVDAGPWTPTHPRRPG